MWFKHNILSAHALKVSAAKCTWNLCKLKSIHNSMSLVKIDCQDFEMKTLKNIVIALP